MSRSLFLLTVLDEDGNEDYIEVPAYSEQQTLAITGISEDKVIDSELAVRKYAYN